MKDQMKMQELNQAQTSIWIWWLWAVCSWHLTQHCLGPGKTEKSVSHCMIAHYWEQILVSYRHVCCVSMSFWRIDREWTMSMLHGSWEVWRVSSEERTSRSSADTNSVIEWQVNQISLNTTTANPVAGCVSVWPIRGWQHYQVSHFTGHLMS